jgi:hypothetical protein
MSACFDDRTGADRHPPRNLCDHVDPLNIDRECDPPVLTTERRLRRLTLVAADAGARFAREGISHDPMAWMLAPRMLFGGARPMDACQERKGFLQATLLHRLSLGLDAHPDLLELLLEDDGAEVGLGDGSSSVPVHAIRSSVERPERPLTFFSCTLEGAHERDGSRLQAYCGLFAESEKLARERLRIRWGVELAMGAVVTEGLDVEAPLAVTLLSQPVRRMLERTRDSGAGNADPAFEFVVEQRFRR